jgi:hypothetical protein
MWTEDEKQKCYNLLMFDENSDYRGCPDFAWCYISKLQNITPYNNLFDPYWDEMPESVKLMVDDAKYGCEKMFSCREKERIMKKNNNSFMSSSKSKMMKSGKMFKNDNTVKSVGILVVLWVLLGLIAFIMSLVCFTRKGTMAQNIVGLLMSVLFGPLYFIYYFMMKDKGYCMM